MFLFAPSLHGIKLELLFKLIFTKGSVGDIRISLKHLNGLSKGLEGCSQGFSFLSYSLGLTQGLLERLILVDLRVELELQSLLRGLD